MNRVMLRRLLVFRSILFLAAAPVLAQDRADAVLVLADDGALEAPAVHAIRNVAASELRRRGIHISEDRRTEGTRPIDGSLSTLAADLGARRLFALRVGGRLGQKIPLSFEELMPGTLAPVYAASLTAVGLEECDVVTARLVEAVVDRRSAESTAGMRSVTATESKPFAKKPGERFWFIGLPVPLYNGNRGTPAGFSLGYGYEGENFRVSATFGGFTRDSDGISYGVLEATWIPLDGEVSPYLGGGLGYMGAGSHGGMGGALEAGVEAFRLHGVRALAGVEAMIPFFDTAHSGITGRSVYPAAFLRLAF
jgi:hypothetical protein